MEYEKILYIIRGPQGSGKSTLANKLTPYVIEADMWFVDKATGEYKFNPSNLKEAHAWCMQVASLWMEANYPVIAVANTFKKLWEYDPYIQKGIRQGYQIRIVNCHGTFENVHNVPAEVVDFCRKNMEEVPDKYKKYIWRF